MQRACVLLLAILLSTAAAPSAVPELHRVATILSQPYWGGGALAVSLNGRILAINSGDAIALYDVKTHTRIRTLQGPVAALAFSPDGMSLAAAWNRLTVYDVATGATRWSVDGVNLDAIAYTGDGKAIVAGGSKPLVGLYDAQTGAMRWQHDGGSIVLTVAVDPTNTYVASGSDGGGLRVWNVDGGEQARGLTAGGKLAHDGRVHALAFKDRDTLLSGGGDGDLKVWNVETGSLLHQTTCVDYVTSIAIRAGHAIAFACAAAGPVVVNPATYQTQRTLADGTLGTQHVVGAPGGWWVEGGDGTLKFYGDGFAHATTVSGKVRTIAFSADRRWYAYSLGDRPIHIRRVADAADYSVVYGLELSQTQVLDFITTLAINPAARLVAGATFTSQGGPDHQGAYDPHLVVLDFNGRILVSRHDLPADRLKFTGGGAQLVAQAPVMSDTPWSVGVVTIANSSAAVRTAPAREQCTTFTSAAAWKANPCALATAAIGPDDAPSLVESLHDRVAQLALPSMRPIRSFALRSDGSPVVLSPDGQSLLSFGDNIRILRAGVLHTVPFDQQSSYGAEFDFGNRTLPVVFPGALRDGRTGYAVELRSAITAQQTARALVLSNHVPKSVWATDDPETLYVGTEAGIEEWSARPSHSAPP
jgi:WD domain, G-beta repeat